MEAVPHVQSYSLVKKWIKKKNLEEKFWHLRAFSLIFCSWGTQWIWNMHGDASPAPFIPTTIIVCKHFLRLNNFAALDDFCVSKCIWGRIMILTMHAPSNWKHFLLTMRTVVREYLVEWINDFAILLALRLCHACVLCTSSLRDFFASSKGTLFIFTASIYLSMVM